MDDKIFELIRSLSGDAQTVLILWMIKELVRVGLILVAIAYVVHQVVRMFTELIRHTTFAAKVARRHGKWWPLTEAEQEAILKAQTQWPEDVQE